MRLLPTQRWRWIFAWSGFALAAVAAALAVHRLYERARREVDQQAQQALADAGRRFAVRAAAAAEAIRTGTAAKLAGFHVDGLAGALRRWDEANDHVASAFVWDEERGFGAGFAPPPGFEAATLPEIWREFRRWRGTHPPAAADAPARSGAFVTGGFPTLANPALDPAELGYQAENLDVLAYAGKPVDPWAGWAAEPARPAAPWLCWYQPGPGAPVRGCFVDASGVLAALRAEFGDARLARVSVAPLGSFASASSPTPLDGFPGWGVAGQTGETFRAKQGELRLTAGLAGAVLALFLGGGAVLAAATRRAAREAERKLTFVAQVSHELRTPLTSIRMFADLLGAAGLPEEKRLQFAARVAGESQRLGGLVERLLLFNSLARGRYRPECRAVDVAALARATLEEAAPALRAAELSVDFSPASSGPVFAHAEPSAVKQALLNLLDNAAKYARGSGAVRVALVRETGAGDVRVRVADGGPGVPSDVRARLFEPFVQGGRTLTDKTPGLGLGLSLSRALLREGGGDLVFQPTASGAVFEIRLPAAPHSPSRTP